MSSINSTQLIWINNRCHRINPTLDKVNIDIQTRNMEDAPPAYEEPNDEEDSPEIDVIFVNNKYTCSLQVPSLVYIVHTYCKYVHVFCINNYFPNLSSVLHSRIIGPKGATKKRLEYETKCQVDIPRIGVEGPVQVFGLSRENVVSCRHRLDMILIAARKKMRPTHFIGVPFKSEALFAKFLEFKKALESYNTVKEDMITNPKKLHVTFNTMPLLDEQDRAKAVEVFHKFHEEHIKDNPRFKDIPVTIKGLNSFQANKLHKCHVLYAEVDSDPLQELANVLYEKFIKQELSFKEFGRETVRMHMTLVKGGKGETFDCEKVLNDLREFDFGTITVSEIHLSQMSTVDPETGYYKATAVLPL